MLLPLQQDLQSGIVFIGANTTVDSGGALSRTLNKPTMADGCVVVLIASGNLSPVPTPTPPTGFTFVRHVEDPTDTYFDIYYKVITNAATEAGTTWTMAYSGTSKGVYHVLSYTGVNTTTPFDVENGVNETGTTVTTHTTPSITTTVANTRIISSFADRLTGGVTYSGATRTLRENDNTGATNAICHYTQDSNGNVAIGTYQDSINLTPGSSKAVMWIGALKPAGGGTNFTQTVTDAVGATDATSTALAYARTQDDPAGLTDAVTGASSFARQQDDDSGLTDSVTSFVAKTQQVDDPAGVTDAVSTAIAYARTQDDPAGLTDSVSPASAYSRQQDDTAGITDSIVTLFGRVVQQDDVVGLTDTFSSALANLRTQSDDSGLTDSFLTALTFNRQQDDPAGITDAVSFTVGPVGVNYTQTVTDDSGLSDIVSGTIVKGFYVFTPPSRIKRAEPEERWNAFYQRLSYQVGLSVLKIGGSYRTVEDPDPDDIAIATAVYLGGRSYSITPTERDDLVAAGYGSYIQ